MDAHAEHRNARHVRAAWVATSSRTRRSARSSSGAVDLVTLRMALDPTPQLVVLG
jgi:hypothetical protein